jgi:hypothetical protein
VSYQKISKIWGLSLVCVLSSSETKLFGYAIAQTWGVEHFYVRAKSQHVSNEFPVITVWELKNIVTLFLHASLLPRVPRF